MGEREPEHIYPAFATPEVRASETSFPFSRSSCAIRSFSLPISSACSIILMSFSLMI